MIGSLRLPIVRGRRRRAVGVGEIPADHIGGRSMAISVTASTRVKDAPTVLVLLAVPAVVFALLLGVFFC